MWSMWADWLARRAFCVSLTEIYLTTGKPPHTNTTIRSQGQCLTFRLAPGFASHTRLRPNICKTLARAHKHNAFESRGHIADMRSFAYACVHIRLHIIRRVYTHTIDMFIVYYHRAVCIASKRGFGVVLRRRRDYVMMMITIISIWAHNNERRRWRWCLAWVRVPCVCVCVFVDGEKTISVFER